jgi:hypothetical protein
LTIPSSTRCSRVHSDAMRSLLAAMLATVALIVVTACAASAYGRAGHGTARRRPVVPTPKTWESSGMG